LLKVVQATQAPPADKKYPELQAVAKEAVQAEAPDPHATQVLEDYPFAVVVTV